MVTAEVGVDVGGTFTDVVLVVDGTLTTAKVPSTTDQSVGEGQYRGGLGLRRTLTLETDAVFSPLTERRRHRPPGAGGGSPGVPGENLIDGETVSAKTTREVTEVTTVTVLTPGGGGCGDPAGRAAEARRRDRTDGKVSDGPGDAVEEERDERTERENAGDHGGDR